MTVFSRRPERLRSGRRYLFIAGQPVLIHFASRAFIFATGGSTFLTATNLYYLQEVGLLTAADVTGDGVVVSECGRRNRNFRVARPDGGSLFVKQVPMFVAETAHSFLKEAACGQLAMEAEEGSVLRATLPRLRRYDPARQVLVYDAFERCRGLSELAVRTGGLADELTDALAGTPAAAHRATMRPGSLLRIATTLTGEVPWVFIIGEKPEQVMPNMSAGAREVVEMIRRTPVLPQGLAQLGQQWSRVCLMHGDFKWDNVLMLEQADGTRELRLLDWELANLGDPLWDVAGGLAMYWQHWLFKQPVDKLAAAFQPAPELERARQSAARFWHGYADAMQPDYRLNEHLALRLTALTGARLVQLAFEMTAKASTLPPHASVALNLAQILLGDPRQAMVNLLGVTLESARQTRAGTATGPTGLTPWKLPGPPATP